MQTLFDRHNQAVEKLVSDRTEEIQTDKSKLKPIGSLHKYYAYVCDTIPTSFIKRQKSAQVDDLNAFY